MNPISRASSLRAKDSSSEQDDISISPKDKKIVASSNSKSQVSRRSIASLRNVPNLKMQDIDQSKSSSFSKKKKTMILVDDVEDQA